MVFIVLLVVLIGVFVWLLIISVSDEDKALEDEDQVEYLKEWRQKRDERISKKR